MCSHEIACPESLFVCVTVKPVRNHGSLSLWRSLIKFLGLVQRSTVVKILKVSKIAEGRTMWKICFIHSHGSILVNKTGVMWWAEWSVTICYGLICCTITTQSKTFWRMCKLGYCKNRGPLYQGLPMGASFSHKAIALVQKGRTGPCPLPWKKKDQNQNLFT